MPFSWEQCVKELSSSIPEQDINRWLRTVQAKEDGDTLLLFVPNEYTEDWIRCECLRQIKHVYQKLEPAKPCRIKLQVGLAPENGAMVSVNSALRPMAALPTNNNAARSGRAFKTYLNAGYTFDGLVSGPPNERAIAAAKGMANKTLHCNPLFIYGGVGLGKTHIMHALGNAFLGKNSDALVAYRHAEHFVSDMVNAFRDGKIERFKDFYRSLDMLLLDDVQMFIGKNQTQEEFFHTFNALTEGGRMMILSSDRYPGNLKGLQARLQSRFCSGLCEFISVPGLEMRVAILERKARALKLDLPRDAAFFIANVMRTNIRELEGALNRIKVAAHFTNEDITIPFIKNTLSDIIVSQNCRITIEDIQNAVAKYYNIRASDLRSKKRTRDIVRPRHIAMALAKKLTSLSYPEIGAAFGGRDHTTVIHACRKVQNLIREEPELEASFQNIMVSLQSGLGQ